MGFSFDRYWNRLETDRRIRDHGPKEQGESVYKTWETCPAFVRPRKRILYRTRIDDTDFLSFSVLIRLIAAYKYSIIRVIECCSMTLGETWRDEKRKKTFVLLPREKLRYRLRLPFLPYFSLCVHSAIHRRNVRGTIFIRERPTIERTVTNNFKIFSHCRTKEAD